MPNHRDPTMFVTSALPALMETIASPEGVAMARGLLYLLAVLAGWTVISAVRRLGKVVTALFRASLMVVALAAVGTVAVVLIAQMALILELG